MKKTKLIISIAVLIYSYLFYQESAGFNFLLFTLVLNAGLLIENKELFKKTFIRLFMFGSILSGMGVAISGSTLSIMANLISLILLSVFTVTNSSLITALLHGGFSFLISWKKILEVWKIKINNAVKAQPNSNPYFTKFLIIGIPVIITLFFFFLYRSSNAIFYEYTKNWSLDFISFDWIFFTLGGLLLVFGFFSPQLIFYVQKVESTFQFNITQYSLKENTLLGKIIHLDNEYLSGTVLLVLLNLLLFCVNILDGSFLFFNIGLSNISFSDAVHQGIGTLIVSIFIAISIILIYLRGHLNFYKTKTFLYLAYAWVLQNIFLVFSTAYKNGLYIHEYGLTYKRIGVYVYLLLAVIGLILTFIKIAKVKTAWYLVCANAWALYVVLLMGSTWNWDGIITNFNMNWAKTNNKQIDLYYLTSLSDNNILQLRVIEYDINSFKISEVEKKNFSQRLKSINNYFEHKYKSTGWKSLTYTQYCTYQVITKNN
jgi:hypothetical protein